jgi:excisionase family DNA binding protein
MRVAKSGKRSIKVKMVRRAIKKPPAFLGLELLTPDQACEYLGMSRVTLLKRTRNGDIPAGKIGGTYRYQKEALYKWSTKKPHQQ